ncbi:hypothetical protein TIFTF001_032284 [Ficus carica]|uniref:Uncharacterized protein n=1 Tax=Ficus carica TaxID=3494 RepID=A0AA88DWY8_FICCA|nr:hypothetical protein TIFTF001_032284 [Ficus carica]
MSSHIMASSSPPPNTTTVPPSVNRRSANFHPSIWGDRFLSFDSNPKMLNTRT